MTTLWLDTETYSEADLGKVGTHQYAAHPSTEITVAQWAVDDGEPVVEDLTGRLPPSEELQRHLADPNVIVICHNVAFDRTLMRHVWRVVVPIERFRDTMVRGLLHGLPGALGKIGAIFELSEEEAKDKRGKELINLFCKPRPKGSKIKRATRETHPEEWAEFLWYSRQDIVSMRAIARKMPKWNYDDGKPELALWHLDQKINDRGFKVDVELARAAIRVAEEETARIKAETVEATDGAVTSVSKRDELLRYILEDYGVALPDMKADTLRRRLEDPELPDPVKLLISLRLEATKTSTSKYKALLNAVSEDGRLRNTLQFAGASRTGRWAGRIFQPQNLPRPSLGFDGDMQEDAIRAIKAGTITQLGGAMGILSDCLRGCIISEQGNKLVSADLSNIEGRMLAFLAGEEWKLQAFRDYDLGTGADLYILAFARAFNVPVETVEKWQRQIGKVMELALGYEGGVGAFLTFAAVYNMDLDALADAVHRTAPKGQIARAYEILEWTRKKRRTTYGLTDSVFTACEVLKTMWREAHPKTKQLWADASEAVKAAIEKPGSQFAIGEHLIVRVDGAWLRCRLPSGRVICYLNPKVSEKGDITYAGVNPYTRQWTRIKTYGGKLIENWTQAAARDVLAAHIEEIDEAGYHIVLGVHDELIAETLDTPEFNSDRLAEMMSVVPTWAPGLPLAAAGFETYRYRKD